MTAKVKARSKTRRKRVVVRERIVQQERAAVADRNGKRERVGPTDRNGKKERAAAHERNIVQERNGKSKRVALADRNDFTERVVADDRNAAEERADLQDGNVDKERPFRLDAGDIRRAAAMSREEARMLVDLYYSIQKERVASVLKLSAHQRGVDDLKEPEFLAALRDQLLVPERQAARAMQAYAESQPLGRWAMSNVGVSGILAAGLLAHIDVTRAQTAGAIWNFAGLNPDQEWLEGQKRPYNARLKTLCWKIGESFKRCSGREDCFYGALYRQRKEIEVRRNGAGELAEQAAERLAERQRKRRRVSDEQRAAWEAGKLQPLGLDLRAMRWAVKLFLSHYWQVGREMLGLPIPKPFAIAQLGHAHYLAPPNWPMK